MLNYEAFKEKVKNEIVNYMPPKYSKELFEIVDLTKQNDKKHAALVMVKEQEIIPNLFLEEYYEKYLEDGDVERLLQNIARNYVDCMEQTGEVLTFEVKDYMQVKERLYLAVLNKEKNSEYLQGGCQREVPGTDLTAVVRVLCGDDKETGVTAFTVNDSHLSLWGVTPEEVYAQAYQNTPELFPPLLTSMKDTLRELSFNEATAPLMEIFLQSISETEEAKPYALAAKEQYILTNQQKMHGATTLLYADTLQKIAEETGSSYFILPSSIHELILMKDDGEICAEELQAMVMEINRTDVLPEEVLSDEVFCYDSHTHMLYMATEKEHTKMLADHFLPNGIDYASSDFDMENEEER